MSSNSLEVFVDNWSYLKAELQWLDRVLMLAVARQRKETKEIERVSQSKADRVTSHWWKGLVVLDEEAAYDDCSQRKTGQDGSPLPKVGLQQQIEARVETSRHQGIFLGLPALRTRLQLSTFEKHLILMGLAPEVNRRYARLYGYLQSRDLPPDLRVTQETTRGNSKSIPSSVPMDLPTVDLLLRILCRNDIEWRTARTCLTSSCALMRHNLVELIASPEETFLNHRLKLSAPFVNYLLTDTPSPEALETLLQTAKSAHNPSPVSSLPRYYSVLTPSKKLLVASKTKATKFGPELVLPPALLTALEHLCHRVQLCDQVDSQWAFHRSTPMHPQAALQTAKLGSIALLTGASGTGKTAAALAIAQALETDLFCIDLALINPRDMLEVIQDLGERSPTVLLVKSAQLWLGRSSTLEPAVIHQFFQQRCQRPSITLLSTRFQQAIQRKWQQQIEQVLVFPLPDEAARLKLWQQAFPTQAPLDPALDWQLLARQLPVSGGEIQAIAREAAFYAAAEATETELRLDHILQAWNQKPKPHNRCQVPGGALSWSKGVRCQGRSV
ncbi:MAG: AAA family ATPase [Leptolyngbyaceae bacterium]|nr:AAA family ATPase [Leptolyngbyaceae bacterium]